MTDGNVLVHDTRTGKLLERGGTGQPGTDISPFLQYGNVADGDFDDARGIAYATHDRAFMVFAQRVAKRPARAPPARGRPKRAGH